ncbi:MAG TPA: hypothetical protein VHF05_03775 [Candidatus Paceibacterota bacterium]|nr:hypothetical protein [Candidatus Paceibacterota bacterium]
MIDGSDGSGKRTQAELLQAYFESKGEEALLVSFPRYQEFFGKLLRDLLDGKEGDFISVSPRLASLAYAADRLDAASEIRAALRSGKHVICDRYVSANQIHQGGKISDVSKRIEFLEWLDVMEYRKFGVPRPDISIYLDVPVAISLELMADKAKDAAESNIAHLQASVETAKWLIKHEPDKWIHIECAPWGKMISRKAIHEELVHQLNLKAIR